MPFPIRIHLLDTGRSDAIDAKIRERAEKLERFASIERCEVWVSSAHKHHRRGDLYGVRIRVAISGDDVVIDFQPTEEDLFVATRQAFDAARRRLEDASRRRDGRIKAHPRTAGSRPSSGAFRLRTAEESRAGPVKGHRVRSGSRNVSRKNLKRDRGTNEGPRETSSFLRVHRPLIPFGRKETPPCMPSSASREIERAALSR